ncbi:bacteriorhodopsin [Coleophoma crateriformis]|uniref:Bacteriorhodopsin n=1 Tax=Coleophoma crateriformis TaxID=565419 RepID=A0A3D8RP29_9HELO|nr:bacteriorhodopsin [Coleophoma crateriformis]
MTNNALNVNHDVSNGKSSDINITTHGSDVYWAVCALMTFTTLGIVGSMFKKPRTDRIFHYITASITLVASVAYFSMGSNLGWTPIDVEFVRSNPVVAGINREIFYVRYIDWFITTPLLITDLLLTAGLPWPTILWTILLDWVMIVTGLVGALVRTRYKWGFFTFGCVAMFAVFWNIAWVGRKHARALGGDVYKVYMTCGVITLTIWMLYPIAWGVCEGGNLISPDSEAVFYGILDAIAKPVFGVALIAGHWNIAPARLGLHLRDYDEPISSSRHIDEKKEHLHGHAHGATAGATQTTNPTA